MPPRASGRSKATAKPSTQQTTTAAAGTGSVITPSDTLRDDSNTTLADDADACVDVTVNHSAATSAPPTSTRPSRAKKQQTADAASSAVPLIDSSVASPHPPATQGPAKRTKRDITKTTKEEKSNDAAVAVDADAAMTTRSTRGRAAATKAQTVTAKSKASAATAVSPVKSRSRAKKSYTSESKQDDDDDAMMIDDEAKDDYADDHAAAAMDVDEEEEDAEEGEEADEADVAVLEAEDHWLVGHTDTLWSSRLPASIVGMMQECLTVHELTSRLAVVSKSGYATVRAYAETVSARQQVPDRPFDDVTETRIEFDDADLPPSRLSHMVHSSVKSITATQRPPRSYPQSGMLGARSEKTLVKSTHKLRLMLASPLRHAVVRLRCVDGYPSIPLKVDSCLIDRVCMALPGLRSLDCVLGGKSGAVPIQFPPFLRQLRINLFFPSQKHLSWKARKARGKSWKPGGWSAAACDQFTQSALKAVTVLPHLVAFSIGQAWAAPKHDPNKSVPSDAWQEPIASLVGLRSLVGSTDFLRTSDPAKLQAVLGRLPQLSAIHLLPEAASLPLSVLSSCKHIRLIGSPFAITTESIAVLQKFSSTLTVIKPTDWTHTTTAWLGAMKNLTELHIETKRTVTYGYGAGGYVRSDELPPSPFDADELCDALVSLKQLDVLHVHCNFVESHMQRLVSSLTRLRELHLTSTKLASLRWLTGSSSPTSALAASPAAAAVRASSPWSSTLEALELKCAAIPPADAVHLRSLTSLRALSIEGSFSGPLKASQLFGLTVPSTMLKSLKMFVPRSASEPVPPEEVSAAQVAQHRAEMDARAAAGDIAAAEGSASTQLALMMQFLSNRDFCVAASCCRSWRAAASMPPAWSRHNAATGGNGRRLLLADNQPAFAANLIPKLALWKNCTRIELRTHSRDQHYHYQPSAAVTAAVGISLLRLSHLLRLDDEKIDLTSISTDNLRTHLTAVGQRLRAATYVSFPLSCYGYLTALVELDVTVELVTQCPGVAELSHLKSLVIFKLRSPWIDGRVGEGLRQLSIDGSLRRVLLELKAYAFSFYYADDSVRFRETREAIENCFLALAGQSHIQYAAPDKEPSSGAPSVWLVNNMKPQAGPAVEAAAAAAAAGATTVSVTNGSRLPQRQPAQLTHVELILSSRRGDRFLASALLRLPRMTHCRIIFEQDNRYDRNRLAKELDFADVRQIESEGSLSPLEEFELHGRVSPSQLHTLASIRTLRTLRLTDIAAMLPSDGIEVPAVLFGTTEFGKRGRAILLQQTMEVIARLPELQTLKITRYDLEVVHLRALAKSTSLRSLKLHDISDLPLLTLAELLPEPSPMDEGSGKKKRKQTKKNAEETQSAPAYDAWQAMLLRQEQSNEQVGVGCQQLGIWNLQPGKDVLGVLRLLPTVTSFSWCSSESTMQQQIGWCRARCSQKYNGQYVIAREVAALKDLAAERILLHQSPLRLTLESVIYSSASNDPTLLRSVMDAPTRRNLERVAAALGMTIPDDAEAEKREASIAIAAAKAEAALPLNTHNLTQTLPADFHADLSLEERLLEDELGMEANAREGLAYKERKQQAKNNKRKR